MRLTALPTLEKIALLKLTIIACSIEEYTVDFDTYLASTIRRKISSLKLPTSLHDRVVNLIRPVMTEILCWTLYLRHIHDEVVKFSRTCCSCLTETNLQKHLQWQTVGLIDRGLTSEGLVRDEHLDITFRFVLACNFCFETDILALWQMLSRDMQVKFTKFTFRFLPVVNYWTGRLETAESHDYRFIPNPPFPYAFVFDYSSVYLEAMYDYYESMPYGLRCYLFGTYGRSLGELKSLVLDEERSEEYRSRVTVGLVNVDNVTALKYFLRKFERIKGEKLLEVVAGNHFISNELLVFCLSQMSDAQIVVLLRNGRRSRVLSCLLNSPWQEAFWDYIDRIWNDLTPSNFADLFSYLRNFKIRGIWLDYDYSSDLQVLKDRSNQPRERLRN